MRTIKDMKNNSALKELGIEFTSYVGYIKFTVNKNPLATLHHASTATTAEQALNRAVAAPEVIEAWERLVDSRERFVRGNDRTAVRDARQACSTIRKALISESLSLPSILKDF